VLVGTPAWYAWLATASTFAFTGEGGTFTARKERAGNKRGGWYWKAYRTQHGTLSSSYLGKSEALTLTRLNAAARMLGRAAGAVVEGAEPQIVMDEELERWVAPPPGYVEQEIARQLAEVERRRQLYAGARPPLSVAGRTAIVVDSMGLTYRGIVRTEFFTFDDIRKVDVLHGPVTVYAIRGKGRFVHFTSFVKHHQILVALLIGRAGLAPMRR